LHNQKKVEIINDSIKRWSNCPFGPPIEVRRGGFWAKHMGLK
jgi:hypothetical protein